MKAAFVALFFALLSLPSVLTLSEIGQVALVSENRKLAPPPSLQGSIGLVLKGADSWFSDHFGLRSLLIRTSKRRKATFFAALKSLDPPWTLTALN